VLAGVEDKRQQISTYSSSIKYGGAPNDVRRATFTEGAALANATKLLAMSPLFHLNADADAIASPGTGKAVVFKHQIWCAKSRERASAYEPRKLRVTQVNQRVGRKQLMGVSSTGYQAELYHETSSRWAQGGLKVARSGTNWFNSFTSQRGKTAEMPAYSSPK
jgi:hypothetical protein